MKANFYTADTFSMQVSFRQKSVAAKLPLRRSDWHIVAEHWGAFLSHQTPFRAITRHTRKQRHWQVAVELCGDQRIRTLNRSYRRKDKVTDVLSFPQHADLRTLPQDFFPAEVPTSLGDIVICLPQLQRQATTHQVSVMVELLHLLNHGFLHLIGLDHEISAKEQTLMQRWEDHLVEKMFNDLTGSKEK